MTIERLDHVQITIPPGTEAEGRAFYCGLLGLVEIAKPPALRDRGGFWATLGDQQLHVGIEAAAEGRTEGPPRRAHVAYQVRDLAAWRRHLAHHGVKTTDGVPFDERARCECRDPFGNRVEFIEPRGNG